MRARATFACLVLAGLGLLSSTGCIVIGAGWHWPSGGSRVWTEPVTERIQIDAADFEGLETRTHNGSITFDGQTGTAEAHVTVTKKGGGLTMADAEAALEAIEVYVKVAGDDTGRIGWKWKGIKRSHWGARVSFDIKAPGDIRFDGETHNGPIEISGVAGDVRVVTHNGGVKVESADGKLHAKTHNGPVTATYAGDDITLVTHNGRVSADLSRCGAISGHIRTHNGSVGVVVGEAASADLTCRTHNGAIKCNVPLNESLFSRRKLTGTIGTGEGNLDVITHNGSVNIKKASG